jgi:hypothetical protein
MFTPLAIAGREVVNPGQELEFIQRHLLGPDTQLLVELPLRGSLNARDSGPKFCAGLPRNAQWMRAARIRPHIGERDLFRGALLKQKAIVRVKKEH